MARRYLLLHRNMSTFVRTINLAEPKTCERPRRIQKLVDADVKRSCPSVERVTTGYQPLRVVPVRICRREDLQRKCQPKFCDCPQKPPPVTLKERLCRLTVFGMKGALAYGIVYWTVSEGIWGDCEDTEDFYTRLREMVVGADFSGTEETFPHLGDLKFKILDTYNRTIILIMETIAAVPMSINKAIQDLLFPCEPVVDDPKKKKPS